jgi:EmrB/QacA subfamily drug resistance transporter
MNEIDNHRRNQLLLVLFIGVLMGALDIAIVGPALPAIQAYFGVGERAIAWIFAIYVLFNLVGTPLMAKLSDALGRRSIYVLDVTLFALGSLLVASAPNFGLLLVGRAVQGFGAGGIFPVASAVIGDTFPPEKRGSALGLIGAVFGLAFLVGPILGGVLLMFDWRWLFVVNLPIALVVIAMSLRLLPATRPEQRRLFDWPGMAVLGLLLASLAYGLNQIDTEHLMASVTSLNVWPFLLAVLALLPIFWWVERRAQDPVLRLSLFNSRQVVIASALAGGSGLGEAAVVFIPALVVAAFGVTSSTASFMLVPAVLAMGVGAPLSGRMLDRLGARMVVMVGTALVTAGMLLVSLLSINLVLFYLAAILVGLGLSSLLGASLRYIMLNEAPASDRAAAQGALTIFISVGQLLSGALVGAVAASRGGGVTGYQSAYLLVGIVALLLTLLSSGLKGHAEELAAAKRGETSASAEPEPARAHSGTQQRGSET